MSPGFGAVAPDGAGVQEGQVMKGFVRGALAGLGVLGLHASLALGAETGFQFQSADGRHQMEINNRVQVRFTQANPDVGDSEGAFRIRRYKFKIDGKVYDHWKFRLQVNFASGSVAGENEKLLEDAYFQYTAKHWIQPWLGQGKAWFGRQELTSSGKQQFVDRSIASERFAASRQTGVGIVGQNSEKTFEYDLGVFNGEGINKKDNPGGDYMVVARAVYMPFGEYKLEESALDAPESSKLSVGLAVLTN